MSGRLQQGFTRNVKLGAGTLRLLMNLWPPFIGAGIHVERLSPDYTEAVVRMRLGLFNRNHMGTHFGGSLYAMTDPFFALLVLHQLGSGYVVWDKASRIDYKLPGRGTVRATFRVTPAQVEAIRHATAGGDKHEPVFTVDVVNRKGEVVATVEKTVYVRRKPKA